jgi:hypothetical protein
MGRRAGAASIKKYTKLAPHLQEKGKNNINMNKKTRSGRFLHKFVFGGPGRLSGSSGRLSGPGR